MVLLVNLPGTLFFSSIAVIVIIIVGNSSTVAVRSSGRYHPTFGGRALGLCVCVYYDLRCIGSFSFVDFVMLVTLHRMNGDV